MWSFGDTPYLIVAHEKDALISLKVPGFLGAMCQEVGLETKYVFPLLAVAVAFMCAPHDCRSHRHHLQRMCAVDTLV